VADTLEVRTEPDVKVESTVKAELTVKDLLDAGLHFGHQTRRWNPKMKRYIFDKRNGIHIIDLTKSLEKLIEAQRFVQNVIANGQSILFVGTKKQAQQVVQDVAVQCGQHYVTTRWLGGTLTNRQTLNKSIRRMQDLQKMVDDGSINKVPKKEAARMRHDLEKLDKNLSGLAKMTQLPGALFVVDIIREAIAVKEATKLGIPVVAMVDTNCDPDPIARVIPGNDDAIRAIKIIAESMMAPIKAGNADYSKVAVQINAAREAAAAEDAARGVSQGGGDDRKGPRRRSGPGGGGQRPGGGGGSRSGGGAGGAGGPKRRTTGGAAGGARKPAGEAKTEKAAAPAAEAPKA
jgi:small subunit ribosomal protein S2